MYGVTIYFIAVAGGSRHHGTKYMRARSFRRRETAIHNVYRCMYVYIAIGAFVANVP